MKRSIASFIALNRGTLMLLGVVLSLTVFGIVAWETSAQDQFRDDPRAGSKKQEPILMSPLADGDLDATFLTSNRSGTIPSGVSRIYFPNDPANNAASSAAANDFARFAGMQSTGQIIVAGQGSTGALISLVRLNANGSIDSSFGGAPGGKVSIPLPLPASPTEHRSPQFLDAVMFGDKIIIVGSISFGIADGGSPSNACPNGMLQATDFLIIVVNADGTLDTAFDGNAGVPGNGNGQVRVSAKNCTDSPFGVGVQTDGKIIVGGSSTETTGPPDFINTSFFTFFRLNTDGTRDLSYDTDGTDDGIVFYPVSPAPVPAFGTTDLAVVQTGAHQNKVILFGRGDHSGHGDFLLNRLTTNGTFDMTFGGGTGFRQTHIGAAGQDSSPSRMLLDSTNRIIAGGYLSTAGGMQLSAARYDIDGALDTAGFGSPNGFQTVGSFVLGVTPCNNFDSFPMLLGVDGDNRVAMGSHTNCTGNDVALTRLTSAGALDAGFGTGGRVATHFGQNTGVDNSVTPAGGTIQPDGKIIMTGQLNTSFVSDSDMFAARFQNTQSGGGGGGVCSPSTVTFTQSTPVAIPTGPAVVSSSLVVAGMGTHLLDLDMTTDITHTFPGDLDITIQSPSGTVVTLTSDNAGDNDNVYNGTVWNDDANPAGQVPYVNNNGMVTDHLYVISTLASPLTPEEPLAAFNGENPNGTWTITVSDDATGDGGGLLGWSLAPTTLASAPTIVSTPTVTQSTPVVIPTGPGVVSSTIVVAGAGTSIYDVDLTTAITHTFPGDLDITIQSPAGTVVTLTSDNAVSNDNVYNGTVWNDDANPAGQVPYVNNNGMVTDHLYANLTTATPLTPEEPLAAFNGENPNGTWTITISDDAAPDGGSLNSWSLDIDTYSCPTAAGVTVGGRALTAEGRGLRGARATITDTNGVSRSVLTSSMGRFQFEDVEPGQTYIVSIGSRRFSFSPQVVQVNDNVSDLSFIAGQ